VEKLEVKGNEVSGEVAVVIPPGAAAQQIDRLLLEALNDELNNVAEELGVVLGTHPSRYAKPLPGKDEQGRIRYVVKARTEAGLLVPAHREPRRP
jgi:hypothetical protein